MKLCLFVALVFSLSLEVRAADCVCVKEPHLSAEKIKAGRKRAYGQARAVFAGKVVALDGFTVKLRLTKRWKGDAVDEVILSTGAVPGPDGTPIPEECSYHFRLGEEYLVYAQGTAERMKAHLCSVFPAKDAAEEELGLDEIKPHETLRSEYK
jgi:hypothetical protein